MNASPLRSPASPSFLAACVAAENAREVDALVREQLPCKTHAPGRTPCSGAPAQCRFDDQVVWQEILTKRVAHEAPALLALDFAPSAAAFGIARRGAPLVLDADKPSRRVQSEGPRAWGQAAVWLSRYAKRGPLLEVSDAWSIGTSLSSQSVARYRQYSNGSYDPIFNLREDLMKALVSRKKSFTFCSEHSWVLPPVLFEMDWLRNLELFVPTISSLEGPFGRLGELIKLTIRNAKDAQVLPDALGELHKLKELHLGDLSSLTSLANVAPRLKALQLVRIYGHNKLGDAEAVRQQLFEPEAWHEVSHGHDCSEYCHLIELRRSKAA